MLDEILNKLHFKTKTQKRLNYLELKVKQQDKQIKALAQLVKTQSQAIVDAKGGN